MGVEAGTGALCASLGSLSPLISPTRHVSSHSARLGTCHLLSSVESSCRSFSSVESSCRSFSSAESSKMAPWCSQTLDEVLYPEIGTLETGMLAVSSLHTVYWEVSGCSTGTPVMVLHGGPGGGSRADYRRYFDPARYRIVQMDQRGCGKSTPHAELQDNNTQALVADIEKLRQHLGIDKWVVFGGSWGSTLSLTYAIHHPDRVRALVLRGIFLCRRSELPGTTRKAPTTFSLTSSRRTATTSPRRSAATSSRRTTNG